MRTTGSMARVRSCGRMAGSTSENGRLGDSMEEEGSSMGMARVERVSGSKAEESSGWTKEWK